MALTKKEKAFCENYVTNGGNASRAYQEAYECCIEDARKRYCKTFRKPEVKEYITALQKEAFDAACITAERVALRLAEIAFADRKDEDYAACNKGKDSVKAGLMFLQDNLIIVHPSCTSFITELENFSYQKSKQTGEFTEDTTHEWSHAIDACRYAYSDIYTNTKMKTLNKAALGL